MHAEDDLLILFGYVVSVLISYPIFLGITEWAMDCACCQDKKAIPVYSDSVSKCFNYADQRSSRDENDCFGLDDPRLISKYLAPVEPHPTEELVRQQKSRFPE